MVVYHKTTIILNIYCLWPDGLRCGCSAELTQSFFDLLSHQHHPSLHQSRLYYPHYCYGIELLLLLQLATSLSLVGRIWVCKTVVSLHNFTSSPLWPDVEASHACDVLSLLLWSLLTSWTSPLPVCVCVYHVFVVFHVVRKTHWSHSWPHTYSDNCVTNKMTPSTHVVTTLQLNNADLDVVTLTIDLLAPNKPCTARLLVKIRGGISDRGIHRIITH